MSAVEFATRSDDLHDFRFSRSTDHAGHEHAKNFQTQGLPIANLHGIKEGQTINIVHPLTPGQINLQPIQGGPPLNLQPIAGGQIIQPLTPGQIIQPIQGGQNFVAVQPVTMYRQSVVCILKLINGFIVFRDCFVFFLLFSFLGV